MDRILHSFFERDPVVCARELIGATFEWDGCTARIVETEAYAAEGDPACHTFFRAGSRDFVSAHPAGTTYVYLNYGVHWLFNVLVKGPEGNGFVLLRALQPLSGVEAMQERRGQMPLQGLCSGPGKLTKALGITGSDHGLDFLSSKSRGLYRSEQASVTASSRVGISRAKDFPWRFTETGSPWISGARKMKS